MTQYSFRELRLAETRLMIRYFRTADLDYLHGMGVDPPKMPSEEDWFELLEQDYTRPLENQQFYYVAWEAGSVPVGHCNINKIAFGESAYMHLHIWGNSAPNRALPKAGFTLVKNYETTPGWIAFHQPVNLWVLDREKALSTSG